MIDFATILKAKAYHYKCVSEAVIEFAAEEYATRKMIEENKAALELAKLHKDGAVIGYLAQRIFELEQMIS